MRPVAIRRRQLSLFVPPPVGARLDRLRALLDPVQHDLIPAHVTFCRDAEADGVSPDGLSDMLAAARIGPLSLTFGAAEAFGGHGVRLPCIAGADAFSAARARVLGDTLRMEAPHITLAHPRNSRAPSNDLARARALETPLAVTFREVRLIERRDGAPWCVLATAAL